jgi:hypothetical protein
MFKPADVVRFHSIIAGKEKYHLCIGMRGLFLFINSPKPRMRRGDFVVPRSALPFLEPTETGKSIISCSTIVRMTDGELRHVQAKRLGSLLGTTCATSWSL